MRENIAQPMLTVLVVISAVNGVTAMLTALPLSPLTSAHKIMDSTCAGRTAKGCMNPVTGPAQTSSRRESLCVQTILVMPSTRRARPPAPAGVPVKPPVTPGATIRGLETAPCITAMPALARTRSMFGDTDSSYPRMASYAAAERTPATTPSSTNAGTSV